MINPAAQVIAQVPTLTVGMAVAEVASWPEDRPASGR
jgi:hypothetical protein